MNWLGDRFKKSSEMVAWLDKLLEELSACLTSHGKGEVCRTLGREEKKEEEKIRGEAAVLPGHRLELRLGWIRYSTFLSSARMMPMLLFVDHILSSRLLFCLGLHFLS
ncbi:uncharacterized protein LOC143642817 isoform X2 [Tamandua tetradactyla]|uniref:uncharacterized protein LOC143642817 isoform X2 n=1 Tax=Tamandua tetradactyla TaxID=48850 RepID=UPI00405397A5